MQPVHKNPITLLFCNEITLWKYNGAKNPMTFLFLNVDIYNIYIQKRKGTSMVGAFSEGGLQ
jgi:hypothetical protein